MRPAGSAERMENQIPHLSINTAGFGTLQMQVAGLHRAGPSATLDKACSIALLLYRFSAACQGGNRKICAKPQFSFNHFRSRRHQDSFFGGSGGFGGAGGVGLHTVRPAKYVCRFS